MALKPLSINNANHDTHIYLSSTNYTMGTHKDEELFLQYLALLLLLRSGDVITNPGPPESKRKYTSKNPCSRCGKGVTARSRAISCGSCGQWTHNRCASVSSDVTYIELCYSGDNFNFVCQRCSFYALRSSTTRPMTTSGTFLRLPRHQTSMMI